MIDKREWLVGYPDGSGTARGHNRKLSYTEITAFDEEAGIFKPVISVHESDYYSVNDLAKSIVDSHNSRLNP